VGAIEIVADSAVVTEGVNTRAPLVQDWPGFSVALAQVPLPIVKSALPLDKGVAPKLTVPPVAVKVTVPQVIAVPTVPLLQLGMVPTVIVPAAVPLTPIEVPEPKPGEVATVKVADFGPALDGVKVMVSDVQVAFAPIVLFAQVPPLTVNSESLLLKGAAPKVTGPPTAVMTVVPQPTGAPMLVVPQAIALALAVPQVLESATLWLVAGLLPTLEQAVSATVVWAVPLNCWHTTVRVCAKLKVHADPVAGNQALEFQL
jgi:hypothetical protein